MEIGTAAARLPERQREALALREREGFSYGEIAVAMGIGRDAVATAIARARIGIRDGMRHTMLTSTTAVSADCDRALPLIAMRDDEQLDLGSPDAAWLAAHLGGCETCSLAAAAMREGALAYRRWISSSGLRGSDNAAEARSRGGRRRRRTRTFALLALLLLAVASAASVAAFGGGSSHPAASSAQQAIESAVPVAE